LHRRDFFALWLSGSGGCLMVPKVAAGGAGFVGAGLYYLGEGRKAEREAAGEKRALVPAGAGQELMVASLDRLGLGGIGGYMLDGTRGLGHASGGANPDAGERVSRVGFTVTRNLPTDDARLGFALMQGRYEAYREERAGKPGRPMTEPVYSYSLSWSPGETPTRDEMLYAAETSLEVLGMADHQAVIVEHRDREHPHIHVVVNRVHPTEARAAQVSMDLYKLSRWAEGYERERGQILCERRVENNAQRDTGIAVKDSVSKTRAEEQAERDGGGETLAAWRARQDVLRKEQHAGERRVLWERHQAERKELEGRTRARLVTEKAALKDRYKPLWREAYSSEREHVRHIVERRHGVLERACHAYVHRDELGRQGERLTKGEIFRFALSEKALLERVREVHGRERAALSALQLGELQAISKSAWDQHHRELQPLKERHESERVAHSQMVRQEWRDLREVRSGNRDVSLFAAASDRTTVQSKAADKEAPSTAVEVSPRTSVLTRVWVAFRERLAANGPQNVPTSQPDRGSSVRGGDSQKLDRCDAEKRSAPSDSSPNKPRAEPDRAQLDALIAKAGARFEQKQMERETAAAADARAERIASRIANAGARFEAKVEAQDKAAQEQAQGTEAARQQQKIEKAAEQERQRLEAARQPQRTRPRGMER
jgi:Relaxase/Mobilisation nuclease domain